MSIIMQRDKLKRHGFLFLVKKQGQQEPGSISDTNSHCPEERTSSKCLFLSWIFTRSHRLGTRRSLKLFTNISLSL